MKTFLFLLVTLLLSLTMNAQRMLDIQGDSTSTDTIVTIKVNYKGNTSVVGLSVISDPFFAIPTQKRGIGGHFYGGYRGVEGFSNYGDGVYGESFAGIGVRGESTISVGVHGIGLTSFGVYGESWADYGIFGQSTYSTGGFFVGDQFAIELGGASQPYTPDQDGAVIRTQEDQPDGDMILVSNDDILLHLDDDDSGIGESVRVFNSINTEIMTLGPTGNLTLTGSCSCASDRNRKEHIMAIDPSTIMDKLALLPISQWQFKGEDIRHLGPMAQDFYAVFGLGQGETTISTVDADGVAFAAIQALYQDNQKNIEKIKVQQSQIYILQKGLENLKRQFSLFER